MTDTTTQFPYLLRIPVWIDALGRRRGGKTYDVALIATLPAGEEAPPARIREYYGADAPKDVYRPLSVARLIFQAGDGRFIVVPDVPRNKRSWKLKD